MACPLPPDVELRRAALERWGATEASTTRESSLVEADAELTRAYLDLEFAYGFARLGMRDQATAHLRSSATLPRDPIHDTLTAMYRARIDDALNCRPMTPSFSPALEASYAAGDRVTRYKIDRLLESTRTLTSRRVDGIGAFARKQHSVFGADYERLRLLPPAERIAGLHQLVGGSLGAEQVQGVVDLLVSLPPGDARPIFERLTYDKAWPAGTTGDAMAIAASIDEAHARAFADRLEADKPTREDYGRILARSARALRAHPVVLRSIVERAQKRLFVATESPAVGIATALLVLDQRADAQTILDAALGWLRTPVTLMQRLESTEMLVGAYQLLGARGIPEIEKLGWQYAGVTDSFGTNTHYNLSAIRFNSAIIHGIIGD